jgi:Zn-dependent peptidase ImmA (M78 family)
MTYNNQTPTILASLRGLVPPRQLTFAEALRLAELQSSRLRRLLDVRSLEFPEDAIADMPRIEVRYRAIPTSGLSYWNGTAWVIALNSREPETRQHFTLLHEYKHILDHGHTDKLYGQPGAIADKRAEQAADYFAGCALMPKALVKRLWGEGVQTPEALGEQFGTSPRAVEVRLAQLGLSEPIRRCDPPTWKQPRPGTYYRTHALNLEAP